ncbi:putative RING-H2 finger protein ATL71 [Rutidosis leptorrhynchoides]|uniref:putative RING-H2 finger protein ATL71 n=1 Tax=Rutidosis leptorrhynchoides TaxID=125765 RepID=UPI003A98DC78
MNTTINAGKPSSNTTGNHQTETAYDVGIAFFVLIFILIIFYIYYMCKRSSQAPAPTIDSDSEDDSCVSTSRLDNDILSTFPTFLYSEIMTESHKAASETGAISIDYGSGCSICLADYKPSDVLRLFPECGHLFHMSCIDTWLRVQLTCPVCRNSPT